MSYSHPNKAVPGGCVITFLGFFPIVVGLLLGWGLWKGYQLPSEERSEKWFSGMLQFGGGSLICVLLGLFMIYFGLRMTVSADLTNPYSGSKPKMRF